ncbi:flagellar biosynthetic protein FliO [Stutzerimonas azotifigens]|uniref:flagellar biosynthetic protein FliO n=1 Tax=Stutzerimonas azotifigens TaxID=291995 RepID=UPI000417E831|nr:flagellar biosynthetic protein FliO [Stutzerimonas azotifigens]
MGRFAAFLLALPALPALAAEPAASMSGSDMGGQITKLLFGLLLVVGLIFLLAWLLRRVQQLNPRDAQAIKLVSSRSLGPRDRLVLVQVGGEQILLGMSPGRITPLHVLKDPVILPDAEPASPEFAQRLMELLGKDQKDRH